MQHAVRYCNIATCLVGCERGARSLLDRKFGRAHAEKRPIYATRTDFMCGIDCGNPREPERVGRHWQGAKQGVHSGRGGGAFDAAIGQGDK